MSFALLSEISCNLPQHLIDKMQLNLISMKYILDGVEHNSLSPGDSDGYRRFYNSMRDGKMPTTSLVQPTDVVAVAEPLLAAGNDIFYIGFSSSLSATYDVVSKMLAELNQDYPDRKIISLDSLCAAGGHGVLIAFAHQKRSEGLPIEEVVQLTAEARPNIVHWFTVEDLDHLSRGGRLSKGAAVVGGALNIKPVLHMDDGGRLITVKKMRGRKKALSVLTEEFISRMSSRTTDYPIIIAHGDCNEDAMEVAEQIRSRTGVSEFELTYLDPVIGAHVGPGLMSIYFYGENR